MMMNVENFCLDIFREEIKRQYNHEIENIFQQLCFDLLTSKYPQYSFIPFPTAGQDGSIDHYAFTDNGKKVIVECKKNNTKDNAANALSQLKTKLLENLAKDEAKNNLYKPWFNTELKQYFYCTSAQFSTAKELEDFEKSIKDILIELSNNDDLSHLATVAVKLFTWNTLKPILERDAFCAYKWIVSNTVGISHLDDNATEKSHYKQNLYGSKLAFISRTDYKKQNPNDNIETEKEIFDKLFDVDTHSGILIHGQGGVGKTRLMLELGLMAKEQKWIALRVTKNLKELRDLDLKPNANYCLLFDYIEENTHFTADIADKLFELFPHSHIKIIATSRTSFLMFNDIPKGFFRLDISANQGYIKYVTDEIFRASNLQIEVNNIKPSFAVFIKDDLKNNPQVFQNFQDYIKNRLCKTLGKPNFTNIENKTFAALASLPYKKTQHDKSDPELKSLEKDGWLTCENKEYSSEHDTIIDELIELYLDQPKFAQDEKREEITALIANARNVCSAFRTLDRISEWLLTEKRIADYAFFAEEIKSIDEIDKELMNLVSKTALIDKENRRFIFTYWLAKHPLERRTSFVLPSWLDAKGDIEIVRGYVTPWLAKYPLEIDTHFVLRAWLDAKGDIETVRGYVTPWLEKYPLEMESSFVLQSWLDAKGDIEIVRGYVTPWLEKYPLEIDTHFVLRAWLDAKGDIGIVRGYVTPWLEKFIDDEQATYVIKAWLKAHGELPKEMIEMLFAWVRVHKEKNDIDFVLKRIYKIPKKILQFIPSDITKIAFGWCEKNIDSKESLYMLSYMAKYTRNHYKFLPIVREILNKYIERPLTIKESESCENIMFCAYQNKYFTEESDIELLKRWVNSENSFRSNGIFYIVNDTSYYQRLKELAGSKNIEKLQKFFAQHI